MSSFYFHCQDVCNANISSEKSHEEHANFIVHMAKAVFPFICLAAGLLFDALARRMGQPILSTVILMILGFIIPESCHVLLTINSTVVKSFVERFTWASLDPHEIMLALLPILIFESAFSIEAHEFGKHFVEIIMLAVPFFVLGFFLLAGWVFLLVYLLQLPAWTFSVCLLYSAVISATDPVAVVMLLSKLGVPHRLRLLIEGESLLNDGVAIILYNIMTLIVHQDLGSSDEEPNTVPMAIFLKILFVIISIITGLGLGKLTGLLLSRIRDTLRERAVILLFVYCTYCICESIEGSGVLGVVAYALKLNNQKEFLSIKSAEENRSMWQFLAYWANWILFILTGLVASQNLHSKSASTYSHVYTFLRLLGLGSWGYVGAFVCRFVALALYTLVTGFFEKNHPHWYLPWSYTIMLTWGGLRGSIALLLAMQMGGDDKLSKISTPALFCVSFTVLISNVYHTLTSKMAADRLNLTQISDAKTQRIEALLESLNHHIKTIRSKYLTMHAYFWSEAFWDKVEELSKFDVPSEEESDTSDEKKEDSMEAAHEQAEEETVNRLIIMDVMSAYARTLGDREVISTLSVRHIVNAINEAIDKNGAVDVNRLYSQLQPWEIKRRIGRVLNDRLLANIENGCNSFPKAKQWFIGSKYPISSDLWQIFWHVFVFVHCGVIFYAQLSFKTDYGYMYHDQYYQRILYLLCLCSLLLSCEIAGRFWIFRGETRTYISNRTFWRIFDLTRLVIYLCTVIVIVYILTKCFGSSICNSESSTIRKLQFLIFAPLIGIIAFPFWLFYLIPRVTIMQLNESIVSADNVTLECMHGILLIAEHLLEKLESENGIVLDSEDMRGKFEGENLKMKQDAEKKLIALLNIENSSAKRMMYIKTRQVTRMILSEGLSVLEQKFKGGEIDEYEYLELEKRIKERMIMSQRVFSTLEPPTFENRLKLIPWIANSKKKLDLIQFLKGKSVFKTFAKGDYILRQGEVADGVYFLMSGICRFAKLDGKETKILHLLYAGQFIGEKAFLASSTAGSAALPKRSGSVYAETSCTAYFLASEYAINLLSRDPAIAKSFEENDAAYSCSDAIRRRQAYSTWTAPALEKFIREKWKIHDREETLPDIKPSAALVCIKGEFEINEQKVSVNPPNYPVKIYEGPYGGIKALGGERKRCFTLELNEMLQQDSDSEKSSTSMSPRNSYPELGPIKAIDKTPKTFGKAPKTVETTPKLALNKRVKETVGGKNVDKKPKKR